MFDVKYSNQASKFLKQMDKILVKRLLSKIEELIKEPVGHDAKTIKGYKETIFRVRVGDYRILYELDHKEKLIGIIKIDRREKSYNK